VELQSDGKKLAYTGQHSWWALWFNPTETDTNFWARRQWLDSQSQAACVL